MADLRHKHALKSSLHLHCYAKLILVFTAREITPNAISFSETPAFQKHVFFALLLLLLFGLFVEITSVGSPFILIHPDK